ncbi:MAG: hypothetical protein KDA80_10590 [Planctomycetaceae bacterium]|nr:hypothetical protein [Planctomycetaceae bacterium]
MESPSVEFEARGENFQWHFYGAGPDGELRTTDDVFLGNTLTVRPNTKVELDLTSKDYIYTLTSPDGAKEIAVPEMIHRISFVAPQDGDYEFRTDPLCGLRYFHDDVQGRMSVTPASLSIQIE